MAEWDLYSKVLVDGHRAELICDREVKYIE